MNLGGVATQHKGSRVHQACEIYYERYRESVRPTYQKRLASQGPLNRGQKLALLRSVSKELLEEESEEVRGEVMAEQLRQREVKDATLDAKDKARSDNADHPEEVQRSVICHWLC